jgi:hypothetical protein
MSAMIEFMKSLLRLPKGWVIWVGILFSVNLAGVFFLPRVEAIVVLVGLMLGGLFQTAIFSSKGFVRLLGLGHVFWIPMVAWLLTRFDIATPQGSFETWMTAVVVFDSLSLLIDIADVARYWLGDRRPQL